MQKWEYRIIWREMDFANIDPMMLGPGAGPVFIWKDILDDKDSSKYLCEMRRLRQLGNEGWELVSVLHEIIGEKHTYTYYLKRALP